MVAPILAGIRILVVEDRADHLETVLHMLGDAGADARGVPTAQEAYDAIQADPPHVLIVDLGLSDIPGGNLVRRIRASRVGTEMAVIAFTANADREKRRGAGGEGFDYYVLKPDVAQLLHVVGHAVGRT